MISRRQPPTRRPSLTRTVVADGITAQVTVGFYPDTGRPAEVFIDAARVGSQMQRILHDAALVISLLLQSGAPPTMLTKSIGRVPATGDLADGSLGRPPASIVGAALDLILEEP